MKVYVFETLLPVGQWDVGEININRVFGQVFQEDVDGGATVNCKQTFFQHDGLEAN